MLQYPYLGCTGPQVKLVKCVVADVVVDVSFDTVGGLCTVAFLEAADRRIGRHHLFKRSILLVRGCGCCHAGPAVCSGGRVGAEAAASCAGQAGS